jgi:(p)ppGpp synthase/HD superfamily hydrolase
METCKEYVHDVAVLSAALLHDVLEDTQVSKRNLSRFLCSIMEKPQAEKTLSLVVELTDVYVKSDYPTLNRRTRKNKEAERLAEISSDAQTIKYADVMDNVVDIVGQDPQFALIYIRECKQLLQEIDKGNPLLYQRAIQTVDECLRSFWNKANVKAL